MTSAALAHSIAAGVGMAYLPSEIVLDDTSLEVIVDGEPRPARIAKQSLVSASTAPSSANG